MRLYAEEYDRQWQYELADFIRYNPGARHRRRLIYSLLKNLKFEDVLDVGCGPAELLLFLAEKFPAVKRFTGIDFAPDVIDRNRQKFPQFEFWVQDIQTTSLQD